MYACTYPALIFVIGEEVPIHSFRNTSSIKLLGIMKYTVDNIIILEELLV